MHACRITMNTLCDTFLCCEKNLKILDLFLLLPSISFSFLGSVPLEYSAGVAGSCESENCKTL